MDLKRFVVCPCFFIVCAVGTSWVLLLCAVTSLGCAVSSGIPGSHTEIKLGKIDFEIPRAERWEMENGLKVVYYRNDEVPVVRLKLFFPGGSLSDDSGIPGLASAAGSQLREGSTRGMSPEELDKRLDDLAASIESDFGEEYGSLGLYSLVEDFDEVFDLLARIARQPAYDAKRLAVWKKLAIEGIKRRRDKPTKMAGMAFNELIYGKGSRFAQSATIDSVKRISRENLKAFHRRFVRPDGAILAVSGAISKEEAKTAIEKHLGGWERGSELRPPLPKVNHRIKPGIYVLERKFDQAQVLMGHRGPTRRVPEDFDIRLFNRIFGQGGFSSVLFREIRSRKGLAYSVYGGIWTGVVEGSMQVYVGTRNEQVSNAIESVFDLIKTSRSELPDKGDFESAKSATERSFIFKFDDPGYIATRAALLEILGYPSDYDHSYLQHIAEVNRDSVRAAAKKFINPEQMVVVVVGNVDAEMLAKKFAKRMEVYRLSFDTEPRVLGRVGS